MRDYERMKLCRKALGVNGEYITLGPPLQPLGTKYLRWLTGHELLTHEEFLVHTQHVVLNLFLWSPHQTTFPNFEHDFWVNE